MLCSAIGVSISASDSSRPPGFNATAISFGETLATSPNMACASAALAALQSTSTGRKSRVHLASAAHLINVVSAALSASTLASMPMLSVKRIDESRVIFSSASTVP